MFWRVDQRVTEGFFKFNFQRSVIEMLEVPYLASRKVNFLREDFATEKTSRPIWQTN